MSGLVVVGSFAGRTALDAQMTAPNPYTIVEGVWAPLPDDRVWGAASAVFMNPDGNIWIGDRCGANSCIGSDIDPMVLYTPNGEVVRTFGGGQIAWPHGMFVDAEGNVWVADATGFGVSPDDLGHVVMKFSPEGELLMTLGERGNPGSGPDLFTQPSDVLVSPNGDIFVADGHGAGGNNRIVKFSSDGTFLMEWGSTGGENGEFRDPHALAMDSQGRLFVGDRANSRIQIFDQDGNHLATWTQFGRPSGLYIDENDVLYATDSESNTGRNPGWQRGIYIGSAETGWVTAFIPDPEPDPDNSATSGAEGVAVGPDGTVYAAQVGPRAFRKYLRR